MKKTLNKILSTLFRSTMLVALLVCAQSVWGAFESSGTWTGGGKVGTPDVTEDITVNLTGAVTISNFITIGKGGILRINNNSGEPVTISCNQTSLECLFAVLTGGTLIITGTESSPIIIDGGTNVTIGKGFPLENTTFTRNNSTKELVRGAIFTEGTVALTYVTLQNIKTTGDRCGAITEKHVGSGSYTLGPITLKNCKIRRCEANYGAALAVHGTATATNTDAKSCAITIENTVIEENYNSQETAFGGILRFTGTASCNLYMKNDTIRNNYSIGAGAGLFWNTGGSNNQKVQANKPICEVEGCVFTENRSEKACGAIRIETTLSFVNKVTKVYNNRAARSGAGLHIYGYQGGKGNIIAKQCDYNLNEYLEVYNNKAEEHGGGIAFEITKDCNLPKDCKINLNINGAKIHDNQAGDEFNGGGIYFSNQSLADSAYQVTVKLDAGTIARNTAANGGGIYIDKANIESSESSNTSSNIIKILDNKSTSVGAKTDNFTGGGGLYLNQGNIELNTVEFKNNTTGTWGRGGGINVVKGNLTLNSGEFENNTAAYGGGIYVNKGILNLNKGTISKNTATESGGGICAAENSEIHSSDKEGEVITIEYNVAQKGHGGGIAVRGEITMNKLYLSNNTALNEDVNESGLAMGCGGGIFVSGTDKNKIYLTLNSGDIENNHANMGGGIYVQNGSIATGKDEIVNVKNNTALQMGGGILLNSGDATMNEVHFKNNKASASDETGKEGYGGGIFVYNGNLTLNSGDFTGNEADHGGGVYVRDGHIYTGTGTANILDIKQNKAYEDGGGIYLEGGDITLNTANIIENTANIIENTATEHTLGNGGGICISSGTISINTGEIIGNKANNYGGGLYVYNPSDKTKTATFSGGVFYKNTANNAGGAVAIDGKIDLELSCTVDGNTAPCGGGVFMRNHATMTFKAGLIRNNKATGMPKGVSTAFQLSADKLEGTGGGIFMGNNTTLKFAPGENTIGLYNNRADFAADDLFANMETTTANLPAVANMNLRDYDVPTTRLYWVEDYPIGDTKYADFGTNLKQASDTIRRYQESLREMKEVYILDDANLTNYTNKYLCLALGYELVFLNLTKKGLAPYDDATFLFYYKNKKEEEVLYREVLVTGAPNGEPVSEIVVLPSGYWRVVESTWSSLYESAPKFDPEPGPDTDPVTGEAVPAGYHLFDNKTYNKLEVTNTQKEIDIREADHRKVNRLVPL